MVQTAQKTKEIDFLTYCRLTANVYPEYKYKDNPLSDDDNTWARIKLTDGSRDYGDLYDFDFYNKDTVCRLGFNPTEKNRGYKTKLKTVA